MKDTKDEALLSRKVDESGFDTFLYLVGKTY
jgi:hypothetical protein